MLNSQSSFQTPLYSLLGNETIGAEAWLVSTILLVEDDTNFSATLMALLEDNNYEVAVATSAEEAIAEAKRQSFHLLLTDVRIAGPNDGVTALEAIQKLQPNIRSIIMTGYADSEVPLRAASLRADDYLHKPFKLKDLLGAIKAVLQQGTAFRSLYQRVAEVPVQATQRAMRWVFDGHLQKLNTAREHCAKSFFLLLRANHLTKKLGYQFYCNWEQLELQYLAAQSPAQWKALTLEYQKFNTRPPTGPREDSVSYELFQQLLKKIMSGQVELVQLYRAVELLHIPESRRESLEAYSVYHWLWDTSPVDEDAFVGLTINNYKLKSLRSGGQGGLVRLYEAQKEGFTRPDDLVLCLKPNSETTPLEEQELKSKRATILDRRLGYHFLLYKGYGLSLKMNLPAEGVSPQKAWEILKPVFLQVRDQYHSQERYSGCFSLQDIDCVPGQAYQLRVFNDEQYRQIHKSKKMTSLYTAPEIFEQDRPTAAADQAVLGRILFEVIMGGNYPDAETRINVRLMGNPQADAYLRTCIPRLGPLARPFYLMCQYNPQKRFASLDQAITAIETALLQP